MPCGGLVLFPSIHLSASAFSCIYFEFAAIKCGSLMFSGLRNSMGHFVEEIDDEGKGTTVYLLGSLELNYRRDASASRCVHPPRFSVRFSWTCDFANSIWEL